MFEKEIGSKDVATYIRGTCISACWSVGCSEEDWRESFSDGFPLEVPSSSLEAGSAKTRRLLTAPGVFDLNIPWAEKESISVSQ